ncbi:hypothetical protein B0T20DRAFT_420378 [Sordaria brevicollis]|uniref:Uncharacterized protein n=1 Tax=Sordaria brevicollis TaxID=83679 RepID=A0AAE0U9I3_SORBR|nr:hypothetical protein B0T20DRAFT_420378 [Sordaria brevicollis]
MLLFSFLLHEVHYKAFSLWVLIVCFGSVRMPGVFVQECLVSSLTRFLFYDFATPKIKSQHPEPPTMSQDIVTAYGMIIDISQFLLYQPTHLDLDKPSTYYFPVKTSTEQPVPYLPPSPTTHLTLSETHLRLRRSGESLTVHNILCALHLLYVYQVPLGRGAGDCMELFEALKRP